MNLRNLSPFSFLIFSWRRPRYASIGVLRIYWHFYDTKRTPRTGVSLQVSRQGIKENFQFRKGFDFIIRLNIFRSGFALGVHPAGFHTGILAA